MLRSFTKPALTIDGQIAHLRGHGLIVESEDFARFWLSNVSYYRLSAYWLYFERPKNEGGPRFRIGTRFEDVTNLYDFDRNLRRMVMRGTEHVEVALRGSWAYQLAHCGGSHSYLNVDIYRNRDALRASLKKLTNAVNASSETYIKHYRDNYGDPALPPVWMVAEMMSFGQLSRWYSNLSDRALKTRIAEPLGLSATVLVPLVRHVTDIRNICAHHGRLWNRRFLQPPKLASNPPELRHSLDLEANQAPAKLYNGLTMIGHIVRHVAPASTWSADLANLIATNPFCDFAAMGFPANWKQRPLWS